MVDAMPNPGPPDVVENEGARPSPEGDRSPTLASFFRRRMVFGVLGVILVVGAFAVASRSSADVTVPDLVGVRVDPRLDTLRLRLEAADLVLGDVAVGPCPTFEVPGASLEQLPGTIVEQHPTAGANVVTSTAVDVTVCLPGTG
jgi:hypothetical protein